MLQLFAEIFVFLHFKNRLALTDKIVQNNKEQVASARTASQFADVDITDYVDIILAGGERGDEAMYYLLHRRLKQQLRGRFEVYQHQLMDEYEDVIEDFFLYLREGKNGLVKTPYLSLRRIRKREAFEAWMLNTFRNYLAVRSEAEKQMICTELHEEHISATDTSTSLLTDEQKLDIASNLIAYAHQMLYPRDRFIFLRTLLSLLNKQQALPNEEMAEALGMTSVSYRVVVHRLKRNLASIRVRLLQGVDLSLDDYHRKMAQLINDNFTHLYPILFTYYCQSVEALLYALAVKRLRQDYLNATGQSLHESETSYSITPSVSAFWTMLSHICV